MSKHMTIINLACTITKLRKWGEAWKHSAESAQAATARMHQAHEAKMVEHRAAFGARTEADAKIIAGLRAEIDSLKREELATNETLKPLVDRVVTERDVLLTQVQDMRAEIERLQWENKTMHKDAEDGYAAAIKVLGDPVALSKERDALREEIAELKTQLERLTSWAAKNQAARETLQNEIEKLKSQTPKHPVKVGEWVRRTKKCAHFGHVAKVLAFIEPCSYEVQCIEGRGIWYFHNCEPCDPPEAMHAEPDLTHLHAKGKEAWSDVPNATQWVEEMRGNSEATHDTVQGKAAAESALNTDPMCVGDEVEVIGRSAPAPGSGMFTGTIAPVGTRGTATMIHRTAGFVELDNGTRASIKDVRKVTT